MIEELNIVGVYLPAALVWASIAGVIAWLLRNLLQRLTLHRVLWHPNLLELALFALAWLALTVLADRFFPLAAIT